MKYTKTLIILTIFLFTNTKASAQDATFTQWENMPLHFNPALTGNFEGTLRFRAKYRNQWQSILGKSSYRTSAASADYKFKTGDKRQFSLGFHALSDKVGSAVFKTNTYNLSTSLVQKINTNHSIAIGFSGGLGNNSLNTDSLRFATPEPLLNSKVDYGDVSVGLSWQYVRDTHFSFQLGAAFSHVNKPNVSLRQNGDSRLESRFNLHGNIEIPLTEKVSLIPSFLFSKQDFYEQLLFGFSGKWYLKSADTNFVQVGLFAKTATNFNGVDVNVYVLSASVEIKSILLGFSFDRFSRIGSNAYEFSAGYTLGRS